jgi:D-alanyl-D-alanine carboxypeptidase
MADVTATDQALPPPNVTSVPGLTDLENVTQPAPKQPIASSTAATPTEEQGCALYLNTQTLLAPVVNRDVAIDKHYEPDDLQTPTLAYRNAYIVPTTLRRAVLQPLYDMLKASNNAGLQIMVVSGYRSYAQQQAAYEKWSELYPDRASAISALPGHSEHQLGLAIDFSTPYMEGLYHNLFHVNFAKTPEGKWLAENAVNFGFTLSFPEWGKEQTGYDWEPWHFRFVGVALAQHLATHKISLTQFIRECSGK